MGVRLVTTRVCPPGWSVLAIVMTQLTERPPLTQIVCGVLSTLIACCGKVSVPGVAELGTVVPIPLSPTSVRAPGELSVIVMLPVRGPVAPGVKVTVIEHLAFGANCVPQGLGLGLGVVALGNSPKSLAFAPVMLMPAMLRVPTPMFCKVTNCEAEVSLTPSFPKEYSMPTARPAAPCLGQRGPQRAARCWRRR